MEDLKIRFSRTSPSLHLILLILIFGLALLGYVAVIWSGQLHGYSPSRIVAGRDLALFLPVLAIFFWLTRNQRHRGEILLLTASIMLFAMGMLMQYRLFSDPEYGARAGERAKAREAKAQVIRLLNVETGYDDQKKAFMFGSADAVPEKPSAAKLPVYERSLGDILTSVNTYIPIVALLAFVIGYRLFRNDQMLLWFQRHALIIGLFTMIPFAILAFLSEE